MNYRVLALILIFTGLSNASVAETALYQSVPAQSTDGSLRLQDPWSHILEVHDGAVIYSAACCKVCRKGKACGDSCIKRSYTCRKGVGCACDG